tara:strand:- start:413 stop:577 length:165 start_codon:yes stop_codon:yes gene_type:complete
MIEAHKQAAIKWIVGNRPLNRLSWSLSTGGSGKYSQKQIEGIMPLSLQNVGAAD